MNAHFRREPPMQRSAPPLGHFIDRNGLRMVAGMLSIRETQAALATILSWLQQTPRMPTKAEEGSLPHG